MRNLACLFVGLTLLISCHSENATSESKEYETSKINVLQNEQEHPKKFLRITGHKKRNIVGQTVVRGSIQNTAVLAKFEDVLVKFYFYSKTKTLLETEEETIYDVFFPGETKKFKTKYFTPKGTDSVALEILDARIGS